MSPLNPIQIMQGKCVQRCMNLTHPASIHIFGSPQSNIFHLANYRKYGLHLKGLMPGKPSQVNKT